jgi:hypothetical protein
MQKYFKKYDVLKRGRCLDLVASGKRACAKELLLEGEDRHMGLVVSGKRKCAEGLLFAGEDRYLGLVVKAVFENNLYFVEITFPPSTEKFKALVDIRASISLIHASIAKGNCLRLRIPNSTRSFKVDRRETGAVLGNCL